MPARVFTESATFTKVSKALCHHFTSENCKHRARTAGLADLRYTLFELQKVGPRFSASKLVKPHTLLLRRACGEPMRVSSNCTLLLMPAFDVQSHKQSSPRSRKIKLEVNRSAEPVLVFWQLSGSGYKQRQICKVGAELHVKILRRQGLRLSRPVCSLITDCTSGAGCQPQSSSREGDESCS